MVCVSVSFFIFQGGPEATVRGGADFVSDKKTEGANCLGYSQLLFHFIKDKKGKCTLRTVYKLLYTEK